MKHSIIKLLFLFLISSCSNISFLRNTSKSELYSKRFLTNISKIKTEINQGKKELAILDLKNLHKKNILLPSEESYIQNLLGIIYYEQKDFEIALSYFDKAILTSSLDIELNAQISLNIASSKYKLGELDTTYAILSEIDYSLLLPNEEKKYHKLMYFIANALEKKDEALTSLILYFKYQKSFNDIKSDSLYEITKQSFAKLDRDTLMGYMKSFSQKSPYVIAFIGLNEVKRDQVLGNLERSNYLLNWLEEEFNNLKDIAKSFTEFKSKIDLNTEIDLLKIGVVLPLSGAKARYGLRALKSITYRYDILTKKFKLPFSLVIKDSQSSAKMGALQVLSLIKKEHVPIIIGGLSSRESTSEYKIASSLGTLFLSLSTVSLPSHKKNHLLVEMPGSLESQLMLVSTEKFKKYMGDNVVLMSPNNEKGDSFVDEVWKRKEMLAINLLDVSRFETKSFSSGKSVKSLLSLKFPRERQEELDFFTNLKSKDYRNWKSRQLLQPIVNFDWIFVLSSTSKALQIIPSFPYYDVPDVKLVGGPSWRSRKLLKQASRRTHIYYIGDKYSELKNRNIKKLSSEKLLSDRDNQLGNNQNIKTSEVSEVEKNIIVASQNKSKTFDEKFSSSMKLAAGLLEHLSFEAIDLSVNLLRENTDIESRFEFSRLVSKLQNLKSFNLSSDIVNQDRWKKINALWIKKMFLYRCKKNYSYKVL